MNAQLQAESEKLLASWMRHDSEKLRDYLVSSVEDPRLNLQSIFSRHFLLRAVFERATPDENSQDESSELRNALIEHEYRFSAVMNWLKDLEERLGHEAEIDALLYSLNRRADNAEGLIIPGFVVETFAALPANICGLIVPNYIEVFLNRLKAGLAQNKASLDSPEMNTFRDLWTHALQTTTPVHPCVSVVEPACGSANDFRYLDDYGITRYVDYTGFDLCPKNVGNALALFPGAQFKVGNVFEIDAPDKSFELCFLHDLFEHLSLEGIETAAREICRVTQRGICVGFFNMDEIAGHFERPLDDYYWNTLSMARMKGLFGKHGFSAQVVHIGSFLKQTIGCKRTHNPNVYTFLLRPSEDS